MKRVSSTLFGTWPRMALNCHASELSALIESSKVIVDEPVARIASVEFLVNGSGGLDPRRATLGFDNSQFDMRYSGCGGGDLQMPNAQSALYVSKKAQNRLYSTITTEASYYAGKNKYRELQEYGGTISEMRQYFDPANIFAPGRIVIELRPRRPIHVFDPTDDDVNHELARIFRDPLDDLHDMLRSLPDEERNEIVPLRCRDAVMRSKSLSPKTAQLLNSYIFTALLGNAALQIGVGVRFPSARADIVPQLKYMEGSANLALPMRPGVPMDYDITGLYVFEKSQNRIVKMPATAMTDLSMF